MKKFSRFFALLLAGLMILPSYAGAVGSTGIENASFSSFAIGQANAVTAQGEEPAAISYNPAGIADLKGLQIQSNMAFNNIVTFHRDRTGDQTKSSGTLIGVPTGYMTFNPGQVFNDRLVLGIGSDSPFGLTNKYDSNNPATRYTGFKNWVKMFTLKPTVAVKVTDWFSIAAGAMNYRIFDVGQIAAYPNRGLGAGFTTEEDGQFRANLSGSHWGWHLGTMIKPRPKHSLGFYFRSPVKVHVRGRVKLEGLATNFGVANNSVQEVGAYSNLDFPMNMTWGYAYKLTEKTTLEADFGYTRWSTHDRFHVIATDSFSPGAHDTLLSSIGTNSNLDNKDYRDTFSIHLGGNHRFSDKFRIMFGTLFYTAAVPKNNFTPAVPDSSRIAFSLGASYKLSDYLMTEFAYFEMLGLRRHIDNAMGESVGGTGDGSYFTNYQVLMLSMRFMWENLFEGNTEKKAEDKKEPAPKIYDTTVKK